MKLLKPAALLCFTVIFMSLPSCKEPEDADIIFTEKYISSPKDVLFEYYSPDPCCIGKFNYVTANGNASELVLKCKNSSYISITGVYDSRLPDRDDSETIGIEKDGVFTSRYGGWSVTVIDSNCLKFVFNEVEDRKADNAESEASLDECSYVNLTTPSGEKESIQVTRLFDSSINLNR